MLRFPSLVFSRSLSSLKVSESLTANALTIPSRIGSWINRSSFAAWAGEGLGRAAGGRVGAAASFCLATVPPCDHDTKNDVLYSESKRHQHVRPGKRSKQCKRSERHEAKAHNRNHSNGERSAGNNGDPVKKQPRSRHQMKQTIHIKNHCKH